MTEDHGTQRQVGASRLTRLTIENFRGIREQQSFDLNASAVLFWGPNGTGKTTLFDAMLWLLQGTIPRLARYTMRKTDDYICNAYRRGQPALVEAELRIDGRLLCVRRRGDSRESSLEVVVDDGIETSGAAAEELLQALLVRGQLPLSEVLSTSGLLQQDDLRLLLRDKPDQRYGQLLRLLGLEVLEQFVRSARNLQTEARTSAREALANLEAERRLLSALEEQAETIRLQAQRSATAVADSSAFDIAIRDVGSLLKVNLVESTPDEFAALASEAELLSQRAQSTLFALERLPALINDPSIDEIAVEEALAVASAEAHDAALSVAAAETEREQAVRTHDAINSLATLAIPLLEQAHHQRGEKTPCPVCLTPIDALAVIVQLSERAQAGALLAATESRISQARAAEASVRARIGEINAAREALAEQRRRHQETLSMALSTRDALLALTSGQRLQVVLPDALARAAAMPAESVLQLLLETRQQLATVLGGAATMLVKLGATASTASHAGQAIRVAAERASQLPKLDAQISTRANVARERQSEYDQARRQETRATALSDSATAGTEQLLRERFAGLEPLMNDIYARMDPHPAFTRLDFRVETYRSRGTATATVTDEARDVQANPLLVFSSAQANIVVISAFLALGWAAGDRGLPFVLMDDPLQALDDVNVLGFADLTRQLRRQRQLLLATHEERFARVFERKLAGRHHGEDLIIHRFVSWSREGPRVETRRIEAREDLGLRVLAS